MPRTAQRVLAFLTLVGERDRAYIAAMLWPDGPDSQALASLRSALWRLNGSCLGLVHADEGRLCLEPDTGVDVKEFLTYASGLHTGTDVPLDRAFDALGSCDLLPGWYDDWVLLAQERLRQRQLHALEALADRFAADGRYAEALESAYLAVALEPLRESAHRAVIRVHLAEGNLSEAVRHFERFRCQLHTELGIGPTRQIVALVAPLIQAGGAAVTQPHLQPIDLS